MVNIVPGPGATVGHALAVSMLVDKIAFTGGTKTGRSIMQAATSNLKKISLELGGKSPNIVFADADFDTAVDYALFGIFANAGQVCSAGSRLVVERSLRDRFVERLVERAQKFASATDSILKRRWGRLSRRCIANGSKPTSQPASKRARNCSAAESVSAVRSRAETSSRRRSSTARRPNMRIVKEEIFGPVLVVQTFDDEAEAIAIANDTVYGLAGAVFTGDIAKAHRVIRKLRAGITWINTYHPTYNEAPWGGYKQSGIGRELGTYGYDAYTEVKQINVNLDVAPSGWFSDT